MSELLKTFFINYPLHICLLQNIYFIFGHYLHSYTFAEQLFYSKTNNSYLLLT
jgi:hypothetical protein